MKQKWISKDACRKIGGWPCYCAFWEIYTDDDELVSYVCESLGTVIMPKIGFPKGWYDFESGYNTEPAKIDLLEVANDSILIKVYEVEHSYTKRLYYEGQSNA